MTVPERTTPARAVLGIKDVGAARLVYALGLCAGDIIIIRLVAIVEEDVGAFAWSGQVGMRAAAEVEACGERALEVAADGTRARADMERRPT